MRTPNWQESDELCDRLDVALLLLTTKLNDMLMHCQCSTCETMPLSNEKDNPLCVPYNSRPVGENVVNRQHIMGSTDLSQCLSKRHCLMSFARPERPIVIPPWTHYLRCLIWKVTKEFNWVLNEPITRIQFQCTSKQWWKSATWVTIHELTE